MPQSAVQPAFRDPPREAQSVFRAVMSALARPGRIHDIAVGFTAPAPLGAVSAAILLALADSATPLWLDAPLAGSPAVAEFLRFHTGAKLAAAPEEAAFAVVADPGRAPPLAAFALGTPDYPDRSTTIIFQIERLLPEGWRLAGPG